jgi:plastocyanin
MTPGDRIAKGMLTAIFLVAGCSHGVPFFSSGLHDTSRTGKVVDVNIVGEEVTPKKVTVRPGDEVRWVNHRTGKIEVAFTDPLDDRKLSCERNFGVRYSSTIGASESASLCFASPGTLTYVVRMQANVPGSEVIDSGTIEVSTDAGREGASEKTAGDKGAEVSRR